MNDPNIDLLDYQVHQIINTARSIDLETLNIVLKIGEESKKELQGTSLTVLREIRDFRLLIDQMKK